MGGSSVDEYRFGRCWDLHECKVVEVVEAATANYADENCKSALSHSRRRSNRVLKLPSSEIADIVLEEVQNMTLGT